MIWAVLGSMCFVTTASWAGEGPDFNRDIRPILSDNCFHCHGPDAESRKADLRLDTEEGIRAQRDDGSFAVVPGDVGASLLLDMITSDDPDTLMPPPKSKKQLTSTQKSLLRDWVAQGAQWDEHWAYRAPQRPATPDTDASRLRNPIDAFVVQRLRDKGLALSQPAERAGLLRRVSLDLIGLPPSPEAVAAFANDDASDAYERAVDRLLASERFGERWARPWLDLARYADSNGFQADQLRPSWAYRDWVIKALNANMPFDRFTIEQLAGDLLPEPTVDQKIATGFHRTVTCNVEAGVHIEENRVNQVVDRVNTTSTAWLGSTLECAQCHDHKYDPFSMKDYYQFFAFFNNTPQEVEQPSKPTDVSHDFIGPYMDLPDDPDTAARKTSLTRELETLTARQKALDNGAGFETWAEAARDTASNRVDWVAFAVRSFASTGGEGYRLLEDGSVLVTGDVPDKATYTVRADTTLTRLHAVRLDALTHESMAGKGPGRGNAPRPNIILHEFDAWIVTAEGVTNPVTFRKAHAGFSQKNWAVAGAIDANPKTGWAIAPEFGKDHWAVFEAKSPLTLKEGDRLRFSLRQDLGLGRVMGRFKISGLAAPYGKAKLPKDILKLLAKAPGLRSAKETNRLRAHYRKVDPAYTSLSERIAKVQKSLKAVTPDKTLVMVEMPEARKTHIMKRGNYLDTGERVTAGVPGFLHDFDPELPRNRLGLARWLVDRDNPLVARVTVNRWWAEIFGHGLVETVEDFGVQSAPASHPELLDWLAVEFMDSGWDMKHVLRLMVTSTMYQQASRVTPALLAADPKNRFYARGPRFRLDGERIRDTALSISGLLSPQMYGKPVMPYQPDKVWRQIGRNEPKWVEQMDANRWRRAVYIVYRRAAPYPSLVNFDAPDRGNCTVKRNRTNTPIQALTLLNDPAYIEMALALADRILQNAPSRDTAARIAYGIELATGRTARDEEIEILGEALASRAKALAAQPGQGAGIVAAASKAYAPKHKNAEELAAWLYLGNILLNLDEVVTKG